MALSRAPLPSPAPLGVTLGDTLGDTLEEWLSRARPRLLRIARAFGISPESAEDIAQDTALRAWRSLAGVREVDQLDNWINAICRNQCRMYLRARRRAPEPLLLSASVGDEECGDIGGLDVALADARAIDPLDALCAGDAALLLEHAFAYLTPQERALLELRYIHGCSPAEIAHAIGATPQALEARLHRARVHLRRALSEPLRGETEDFGLDVPCDDGWQTTRIGCYLCGRRKLLGRFEPAINGRVELRLRCPACSAPGAGDVFRSKGIASLEGLRAFRPALTRSLHALAERTREALLIGSDVCLHCGSPAPRRVVSADEYPRALSPARRHWVVAPCPQPGCPGMGAWAALDPVIGAEPLAQRFMSGHPHWMTTREESIEWQGRSVIRFDLSDLSSAARLTLLADRHTLQPLATY